MTSEEFAELLRTARRLADTADQIVRVLAARVREEKDPRAHEKFTRMLNSARDCSSSINNALRDAPRK